MEPDDICYSLHRLFQPCLKCKNLSLDIWSVPCCPHKKLSITEYYREYHWTTKALLRLMTWICAFGLCLNLLDIVICSPDFVFVTCKAQLLTRHCGWKLECLQMVWPGSTLLLLIKSCPVLANSADPDQLASEEANWSGSALFAIKYVNFYQKLRSRNLIGWKWAWHLNLFIMRRVKYFSFMFAFLEELLRKSICENSRIIYSISQKKRILSVWVLIKSALAKSF